MAASSLSQVSNNVTLRCIVSIHVEFYIFFVYKSLASSNDGAACHLESYETECLCCCDCYRQMMMIIVPFNEAFIARILQGAFLLMFN